MDNLTERLKFASSWAFRHLLVSAFVSALAAFLVFGLLYPDPWRSILGIGANFGLVVVADLVCGPLLTLVLVSPKKSRRERWVDLSLVASVQLIALAYGLWSVYSARPVMLVFEVDRMVLVTANDIQIEQLGLAPKGLTRLPIFGVRVVGARSATSSQEYLKSLEQSLGGVSPAMRPDWWVSIGAVKDQLLERAKPLDILISKHPEQAQELINAASRTGFGTSELRYLPLTSSKSSEWTALLSPAGLFVGYAPVDGFD